MVVVNNRILEDVIAITFHSLRLAIFHIETIIVSRRSIFNGNPFINFDPALELDLAFKVNIGNEARLT